VLGYMQGAIRQLLGMAVVAVAFVLAAGLREPLGNWFATYWTSVPVQFSWMFAFLAAFLALLILGMILVALFYKRSRVLTRVPHADEVLGAILAVVLALAILAVVVFALDSFYLYRGIPISGGDVGWMRSLHGAINDSAIVSALRVSFIPFLTTALGPLLPEAVRQLVP
jgi:hypothetical protein